MAAAPMGRPGWPDLAFSTASMLRVRSVLMQRRSRSRVGCMQRSCLPVECQNGAHGNTGIRPRRPPVEYAELSRRQLRRLGWSRTYLGGTDAPILSQAVPYLDGVPGPGDPAPRVRGHSYRPP